MTQIHWLSPVSADFNTKADWSTGAVPGPSDDAILNAAGGAYTVTASTNHTVNSVQAAANATLAITGGLFTATAGSGSGVDDGTIAVGNGARFRVGGTMDNVGMIALDSTGAPADLIVGAAGATFSGAGTVTLNPGPFNRVYGVSPGATLTNVNNTIVGSGYIGLRSLTLVNDAAGTIDANARGGLLLDTVGSTVTNAGTLEATGSGILTIADTTVDDSGGGMISAGNGALVTLQNADIIGGSLVTSGSGAVVTDGAANVLDGRAHQVTIANVASRVAVTGGSSLNLEGAISNHGVFQLVGGNLVIDSGGATLSGGGLVEMSRAAAIIASGPATLTNVDNQISGSGTIGNANLTLVNDASGVIYSNSSAALTIDTGANAVNNQGSIVATAGSNLTVAGPVDNGGVLYAYGGTLTVSGAVTGSGVAQIAGATLSFGSSFNENVIFEGSSPRGQLVLAQSQSYTATVSRVLATQTTFDLRDIAFVSAGEATFSGSGGGGTLTVSDGTHTANIHITFFNPSYTALFLASSDGHGGTLVDPVAVHGDVQPHVFVAAMASFGATAAGSVMHANHIEAANHPMLAARMA